MQEYGMDAKEVMTALKTGRRGLSSSQVRTRRQEGGENRLAEKKPPSLLRRILSQLCDPMVLILLGAALVSAIGGGAEGKSDVFVILFVVVLNTLLGVIQQNKAEAALRALKEMTPQRCRVIRDGVEQAIPSAELVVGDIVLIEAGDAIPADGRVIESHSLFVEEAALTGEAAAVEKKDILIDKDAVLADRQNMAYMGSCAVKGNGVMVVTSIGMQTEVGQIASSITQAEQGQTPLQKKLSHLSFTLTLLVLGICLVTFLCGMWKAGVWDFDTALSCFLLSVSLAVAAIPEGMVAVVTIVLSMGVSRMAKRNAIVRSLTAVETLGCTQVICSDKTGTLTQNRMRVTRAWGEESLLPTALALCNDAPCEDADIADPTEIALLAYAKSKGIDKRQIDRTYRRIDQIPFDSDRKRMTTYHKDGDHIVGFTKGAIDVLLPRCVGYLSGNGIRRMDEAMRRKIIEANREFANGALRVIGAAYKITDRLDDTADRETDLVFIGMVGMIDPIRPEAKEAISICHRAGIKVVMITGDHPDTARAIGKELAIWEGEGGILTGAQLSAMDDDHLASILDSCTVFARVQPEHKTRIVSALQKKGLVTAMTGDGVNDAPALKRSDIGIGMGMGGSDVTKGCADLILADDNFATIVCAVEEGRRIWDNICKAIHFLLSSNLSEVVIVFSATMAGVSVLQPIHLLFINLITDSLPALALGMEQAEGDLMKRVPRGEKDGIFSQGAIKHILSQGLLAALLTACAFLLGTWLEYGGGDFFSSIGGTLEKGSTIGRTMAFLTMSMAESFHALNMRSRTCSVFSMKTKNRLLTFAILSSMLLTLALIYCPPLCNLFRLEQIPFPFYLLSLGIAWLMIPFVEVAKWTARRRNSKKEK